MTGGVGPGKSAFNIFAGKTLETHDLPSNAISLKRTQLQIISREYWEPDQIKLTKTKV